jgi:uncharacterized phiE125 gp8 family phage protein
MPVNYERLFIQRTSPTYPGGYEVSTVTAATGNPVTLTEARLFLRNPSTSEDPLISSFITVATNDAQNELNRAIMKQTLKFHYARWPYGTAWPLPFPPLVSVTHVKYITSSGSTETMSSNDYIVDTVSRQGRLVLRSTAAWPASTLWPNLPIYVTAVCGSTSAAVVPEQYKDAIKLRTAKYFEHRGDPLDDPAVRGLDMAFSALLSNDRIYKW